MSKKSNKWLRIRREWLRDNPPNHEGYYECYLCFRWIPASEITLDHVIPRSNAKNYANRDDYNNLRPCCWSCNNEKGSKVY